MTSWSFYIYSSCIVDAGKISERVSQSSHSEWPEKHSISSPGLWNLKHAPCQSGPEDVPGLPTVWAGSPQLLTDRDWHCDQSYWYADLQGSACTFNQFLHTLSTCQWVNFKQFQVFDHYMLNFNNFLLPPVIIIPHKVIPPIWPAEHHMYI